MKVYISVDIEGVAGIAHWDEASKKHNDYAEFQERMTAEAVSACDGALAAGATEIWVKDAHGSGRNIKAEHLPAQAHLIRGWSGHPYDMLQELDDSFAAVVLIGWHGPASDPGNPLSHTLTLRFARVLLNGQPCSEYLLHAHIAALTNTPIVFLSGDARICALAKTTNPQIHTVATNTGHGESVVSIQPALARENITSSVESALRSELSAHVKPRSDHYRLSIQFHHHGVAYEKSFYPGATLDDSVTVSFEHDDFFEVMRMIKFMG